MKKMVGKAFIVSLIFFTVFSTVGVDIQLEIRNGDGVITNTIVAGQPFSIEVIINGVHGSTKTPEVDGIASLNVRNTGMYMSTINGVSTTKYSYQGIINKTGSYPVGPARVMYQQSQYTSPVLMLTVTDQEVAPTGKKKHKTSPLKAFLRLVIDNTTVVVNQKIRAALRFYYQDAATTLTNVSQPDLPDMVIKNITKSAGTVDIDNVHYRYVEWAWDMYSSKAGEFVIPAHNADYELPGAQSSFLGGMFMIGGRSQKKRLYSNAAKITVEPLPPTSLPVVNAVGTFTSFVASISPARAKEGEGMVLTFDLIGKGNVDGAEIKSLIIPSELRCYPSQANILPSDEDQEMYKKRFEFIVQGMKAGEWEIPEQQFVFFDTHKHEYGILRTSALSVSVDGAENKKTDTTFDESGNKNMLDSAVQPAGDSLKLITVLIDYYKEKEPLVWWVFLLLMVIPVIFVYYQHIFCMGERIFKKNVMGERRHALWQARMRIKKIASDNEPEKLYAVFVDLCARLYNFSSTSVSSATIAQHMNERISSDQKRAEWQVFLEKLRRSAYSGYDQKNNYELYRMALEWIDYIKQHV